MNKFTDLQKNNQKVVSTNSPSPAPEKGKVGREFYKDLDKYRHRSGWVSTLTFLIFVVAIIIATWIFLKSHGLI